MSSAVKPLKSPLLAPPVPIEAGAALATAPPAPPIPVPSSVTRFQAFAELTNLGLYAQAESAVTSAGGLALLAWNTAQQFDRNSPTIASLAVALNLTSAQLDQMFIAANQIVA